MTKEPYSRFVKEVSRFIPRERIYTDPLRTLTWGCDAGFYRLTPRVVIRSANEKEVSGVLAAANRCRLPVTLRAAGTSLSGQAIGEGIILVAGKNWQECTVGEGGLTVTLGPGVVGGRVNEILKPLGRRFSPDPASIESAMVGGIVANNASGMRCGTHANSDRMLVSARIVFADGEVLDTGDEASRRDFLARRPEFIRGIEALRDRVRSDETLVRRIHHKYSIKNVMGLNLRPFVAFDDPFEIIAHLMVGSEGTLGFLSQVTMRTEAAPQHKACALLRFDNVGEACGAVVTLSRLRDPEGGIVTAAELLDSLSLDSVGQLTMDGEAALLVETAAQSEAALARNIDAITDALAEFEMVQEARFTADEKEYSKYWSIRSGIFPSVGGTRRHGTTSLIEDVAFRVEDLPGAVCDLQRVLRSHGYDDACIYGHALEGNCHFILNQSFDSPGEVERYGKLMEDVASLVVERRDGSLKAEHGTGRNMAPFVEREWGSEAFAVMRAVKELFDGRGILNPGVIFNDDERCHLKNFKSLTPLDPGVDKCIECGFCEVRCLSCGFTLSARGRIVAQREMARLRSDGGDPRRLRALERAYRYEGDATCAGDGLCAHGCPMGIDTGAFTRTLRGKRRGPKSPAHTIGSLAANHLSEVKSALRGVLAVAYTAHGVVGSRTMGAIGRGLHKVGAPLWTRAMPKPYKMKKGAAAPTPNAKEKVVYFPSCINQTMGEAKGSTEGIPLVDKMTSLLQKAGLEVIFPEGMEGLCCGTIWESKGMTDIADEKSRQLREALWRASRGASTPWCATKARASTA